MCFPPCLVRPGPAGDWTEVYYADRLGQLEREPLLLYLYYSARGSSWAIKSAHSFFIGPIVINIQIRAGVGCAADTGAARRAPNALGRIAPGRGEPIPGSPRARLRLPTAPCVRHWDELGLLGSQQGWCWDEQIMSCWGWKASGWARGTGAWWSCSWAAAAWR